MTKYEIFDAVKGLYNASNDAWRVYYELKQHNDLLCDNGVTLYVCSGKHFANMCFRELYEMLAMAPENEDLKLRSDSNKLTIELIGETTKRWKIVTIKEILKDNAVTGLRVKEIKFYE